MLDAVKNYLALANGVTEVTRQRAVSAAKALVASGEATAEQVGNLADDLLTTSRNNRDTVLRSDPLRDRSRAGPARPGHFRGDRLARCSASSRSRRRVSAAPAPAEYPGGGGAAPAGHPRRPADEARDEGRPQGAGEAHPGQARTGQAGRRRHQPGGGFL